MDEYPTFSLCLKGSELYWNHENMLYTNLGVTSPQFVEILKGSGIRHEYNETSDLYESIPVGINDTLTTNFYDVSLSPFNVIAGVDFVSQKINNTVHYGSGSEGRNILNIPFHIGYQAPDEVCFTRNSSFELELIRVKDLISLERSLLSPGNHLNLDFRVIMHYPGQLLRSFKNPNFRSILSSYTKDKVLELKISHVTTLRKRKDSNVPCNEDIENDDLQILKEILNRIGCIPVYWLHMIPSTEDFNMCDSPSQLRNAYQYIANFEDIMSSYDPPCIEMTSVVKLTRDLEQRDEHFRISIQYVQSFYQEIQNKIAYTFEFYFSSIGGFTGVCVGTSMMEIPSTVELLASRARKIKCPAIFGRFIFSAQTQPIKWYQ